MRSGLRFWAFVVVLYGVSALVQWASWRWLQRVAPKVSARYRAPILATGLAFFVFPLSRELAFVFPGVEGFPLLSALGMLWHVCTWMSMALVGLIRVASWCAARLVRARQTTPLHDRPASAERRIALEGLAGGAAFVGSGALLGWGSVRGRYDWSIEEVPIRMARLPRELDGFTIVQISDIHVGPFVTERELRMGLGLLDRVRPDLIAVTGDIIDAQRAYIPLAARTLGALRARHGVVCIPGNHDHYTGVHEVLGALGAAGLEVLMNRAKIIPSARGAFAILGVDDLWPVEARGGAPPDIVSALAGVPKDAAKVLLAHQPRYVATAAAFGIDLQLSGHTHGGQVNPGVTPLGWFTRYVAGHYDVRGTQLYVNRGFGTVGPPTRVGAPPEITKIVLVAG